MDTWMCLLYFTADSSPVFFRPLFIHLFLNFKHTSLGDGGQVTAGCPCAHPARKSDPRYCAGTGTIPAGCAPHAGLLITSSHHLWLCEALTASGLRLSASEGDAHLYSRHSLSLGLSRSPNRLIRPVSPDLSSFSSALLRTGSVFSQSNALRTLLIRRHGVISFCLSFLVFFSWAITLPVPCKGEPPNSLLLFQASFVIAHHPALEFHRISAPTRKNDQQSAATQLQLARHRGDDRADH
ncbi:hypothetical protein V8C35DRAFT_53540 [Trichoderma chlorosporum]